MELTTKIPTRRTSQSKIKEVNSSTLKFGDFVSDHMLICDYKNGEWMQPHIMPFANLSLSPAALALHYGQTVFEGMKAFYMTNSKINIFRIAKHYDRFVKSLDRMAMAIVPEEIFTEGLRQLIDLDRAWVPKEKDHALYIRPFVIATESRFGVKISEEYRFIIFTGPVPIAYTRPIKVKVETKYVRAAKGGTGFAKCGGNYGGSYYPTQLARKEGYDQVLWTDSKENKYIEESGMMNAMFVVDGTIVTPPLSDSILDGITRDSLLTLARDNGIPVSERPVSIDDLETAFRNQTITEAAGIGTAAVVAPIGIIHLNEIDFHLPEYGPENVLYKLKQQLESIRTGHLADVHEWNCII
ncbi:MAG: branched-chain amino acid aminotransferase [Bacteroidetes bacterium]|nr:branched-chain amino acid aminotransferase [Bacteroidota bacterium]MBS1930675.1 branched-chain amino acid aminotransferase [Bacteroidota bacterium]